ncbi:MAG: adenylyltransferase/cytidyltransferase family protein [Lachnospiraceae bacterium]|nr:adenylyltransferase/cytidyltransferase family protein [Lachnospiraceae bacterium]
MKERRSVKEYISLKKQKRVGQVLSSYGFLGKKRFEEDYKEARLFFALRDAVAYLHDKGVKCYFFHRIDRIDGFSYSESAQKRMKERRNFPLMASEPDKYEEDFRELLGDDYSEEYVGNLSKISQIIKKDNRFCHEDIQGPLINIAGGERVTSGSDINTGSNRMYLYGRCGVFGYAVRDDETMPSQLQKIYNEDHVNIRVVNRGLWGGTDDCIFHDFLFDVESFVPGDVVVFYVKKPDDGLMKSLIENGLKFYDITKEWHEFEEAKWCFYDSPGHMNAVGYKHVAQLISEKIGKESFAHPEGRSNTDKGNYRAYFDYIREEEDSKFRESVMEYVHRIKDKYPVKAADRNGAIVMNCNPFTKGHRYLIEYAVATVDHLFIFVVEENKSFFSFEDRFDMVKAGTADITNVFVIPSGRFIISAMTFPEYFLKDFVQEKGFDVSGDVEIFAKYIAPHLNIYKRFVGEEPFDKVTDHYNETMKRVLPEYGIELCEIPRLEDVDAGIITATKVRELMNNNQVDQLEKFVPDTTMQTVKKYLGN